MHSVPRRPARRPRGNWIWLASGMLAATVLAGATVRYSAGGCRSVTSTPSAMAAGSGLVQRAGHSAGPAAAVGGSGQAANSAPAAGGTPPPANSAPAAVGTPPPAGPRVLPHRPVPVIAVWYEPGSATGSCSLGPFPANGLYASLPPQQFRGGTACGSQLEVRGPRGRVRVEVVDLCPGCAPHMINLSRAAFRRAADPAPGSARVTYWQPADHVALPHVTLTPRGVPPSGARRSGASAAMPAAGC
jgi:expansin